MKIKTLFVFAFCLAIGKISIAQSSITGTWKGSSICQVKNSPCHDEKAIYHISKSSSDDSYLIDAAKIIDGKEYHMGILTFSFDATKQILFLVDDTRNSRWEFNVSGKQMHGALISNGNLVRVIDLKKED